ncbi:MAG: nicotinate phosphoribosyltransferase [Armatimonadota bacterium]
MTECGMGPLGPLFADLYELTMFAGYCACGRADEPAVFEYAFRRLPEQTGFAVFAGLDDLLDDLAGYKFSDEDIAYLASLDLFDARSLEAMRELRFSGDIWAPPEGTPVFPYEPVVRVHAPLAQAQLVETLLLCRLNYQTLIATKAARVRRAAGDDSVLEFGLRRAQGPDGGMSGTRAAIIGGCDSTSNAQAGKCLGVRVVGTQAHSWIMSFPTELAAFRAYASVFPEHLILLVDTYDTLASGVPNAIRVFSELRERGWTGRPGIRIDSGDLAELSIEARRMLSAAGFADTLIVASGDLDEYRMAEIKARGGKVDSWGVGTRLMTGGNEPALGGVYKLAEINGIPTLKISDDPEKSTDPGVKMPVRFYSDGIMQGDVLFTDESWREGEVLSTDRADRNSRRFSGERRPLLLKAMAGGERLFPRKSVTEIRAYALSETRKLPEETRKLTNPLPYWVGLSETLAAEKRRAVESFRRRYAP